MNPELKDIIAAVVYVGLFLLACLFLTPIAGCLDLALRRLGY